MAFSGPSVHRCKCFGEGDGLNGSYYPCPPDLCEAERLEAENAALRAALREIIMAEPNETKNGTAWPSLVGTLQTIAAVALRGER